MAAHGVIEYAAAVLFIVAPFIFDFTAGAAEAASIVIGVAIIFIAATTAGPTSLVDSLPVSVHIVLDYALAVVLIATPFIFGFVQDDGTATAFFIILGVAHLLITIATRFDRLARPAAAAESPSRRR
jgi:hypothetical protein